MSSPRFRFGLEGEYLLVDSATFRPLWHPDLRFTRLYDLLEGIDFVPSCGGLSLDGLELDPPHRRIMPYYVEGYGVADSAMTRWVDVLPKGIEIRTPVCPSLDQCLQVYEGLYQLLQTALASAGYRAVALAHHPTAWEFRGPQNHPRHDWWHWAMRAMTTYGPDLNVSLPEGWRADFDWEDLQRRVNYYAPALAAFSLASPVARGELWQVRGRPGFSMRTYRRSPAAPAVAAHPKEQGRLEFKAFDMPANRSRFRSYFLLWLWLICDRQAPGRAEDEERIYDLGAVARLGWEAEEIAARAEEALDRAARVLAGLDFDPASLRVLRRRLEQRRTPADALIARMSTEPSVPALLRFLDRQAGQPHAAADAQPVRPAAAAPTVPRRAPISPGSPGADERISSPRVLRS